MFSSTIGYGEARPRYSVGDTKVKVSLVVVVDSRCCFSDNNDGLVHCWKISREGTSCLEAVERVILRLKANELFFTVV